MQDGSCSGSQDGAAGADAICADRVSMDASSLSSEYSEHRAMLNRKGGAGPEHPRDLDIPNKENREVQRISDNAVVAENYNSYWDSSYTLNEPVVDAAGNFYWTGIGTGAVLAGSSESCNEWQGVTPSDRGHTGDASKKTWRRFRGDSAPGCGLGTGNFLLCASY